MNFPRLLLLLAAIGLCQSPIGNLAAQPAPVLADPTTGALFRPTNLVTPLGNATGTLLGASGGTGVANTGKTITLGGNVTTVGAYNLGVSLSGNTTVTLPTTGTLATLAGSETLTNKTLTSPTLTTPILGAATATSVTGPTTTDLTLTGGSSGASLVLGQGASAGNATITPTGTGVAAIAGTGSKLTIAGTTASTGVGTGALQVAGGIYAGAASVFGSTLKVGGGSFTNFATGYIYGVLKVGGDASQGAGTIVLGDDGSTGQNVGVWRGTSGGIPGTNTGNVLNLGGYSGVTITTGAAALGSQTVAASFSSSGAATFAGAAITSSATLSGAGAIPITTSLVKFTSTAAANALTLANGVDGQRLTIVHDVKGTLGTGVITPTTKTGFSTITLTSAGDTVDLVYVTTRGWMVTGSYLATITP